MTAALRRSSRSRLTLARTATGGYLKAMRGPGESYSEVITRLANVTAS